MRNNLTSAEARTCWLRLTASIISLCAGLSGVKAQCIEQWLPGAGVAGVSGTVKAVIRWDPDGDGPQESVLVVAGGFAVAGRTTVANIAVWDGARWSALGSGLGVAGLNSVNALAVTPGGDLIAGGTFTVSGATTINRVARWNGTQWVAFDTGVNGAVNALAVAPNGDIIAGGKFTTAGGVTVNRIARWRPSTAAWSAFVTSNGSGQVGVGNSDVNALLVLPNGDIVAGGAFTNLGQETGLNYVARWSTVSSRWFSFGGGVPDVIYALTRLSNGNVVAAGYGNGTGCVRQWDGQAWSVLGPLDLNSGIITGTVYSVVELPNGSVLAAGLFYTSGFAPSGFAVWDGQYWNHRLSLPYVNAQRARILYALCAMPNGNVAVGSRFNEDVNYNDLFADDGPANGISTWDGSEWHTFAEAGSTSDVVSALTPLPNGGLLAGGEFVTLEGVSARRVARWDGAQWSALGPGIDQSFYLPSISAIAELASGDVMVGGSFASLNFGGTPARGFADWNGGYWFAPPLEPSYATVAAIAGTPRQELIVAGAFAGMGGVPGADNIARWDGSSWSALGAGLSGGVNAVVVAPNGQVFAAGYFDMLPGQPASHHVAMWDGTQWTALGSGMDDIIYALALLPNGDLVAGGHFLHADGVAANRIARWNASTHSWLPLGSGVALGIVNDAGVKALAVMPNGDLITGGWFASAGGAPSTAYLARWNGTSWSSVGGGVNGVVNALAVMTDGTLCTAGNFVLAGGQVSAYLARWRCVESSGACCSATVCTIAVSAAACTGSYKGAGSACGSAGNPTTCCIANFDGQGGVAIDDIFSFLNAWFAGIPSANVDGQNGVAIDDIFVYLNLWFAGC